MECVSALHFMMSHVRIWWGRRAHAVHDSPIFLQYIVKIVLLSTYYLADPPITTTSLIKKVASNHKNGTVAQCFSKIPASSTHPPPNQNSLSAPPRHQFPNYLPWAFTMMAEDPSKLFIANILAPTIKRVQNTQNADVPYI